MGSGEHSSPSPDASYSGTSEGPETPAMGSGEHSSPSPDASYSGTSEGAEAAAMGSGGWSDSTGVWRPDVFVDLEVEAGGQAVAQHPGDQVARLETAVHRRQQHLRALVQ